MEVDDEPGPSSLRPGALYNNGSEDEDDDVFLDAGVDIGPVVPHPEDVFPVNRPPKRHKGSGGAAGKRKKTSGAAPTVSATPSNGLAGMTPASIDTAPKEERGDDLLDDRVMTDPDELYNDNERALSSFLRLHPMLSLDATSERVLTRVGELLGDASIPTRELEIVSKAHDDLYLRPPRLDNGERECANGEKCVCRWVAIFRHGEGTDKAFVCREYLLPTQETTFADTGELPRTCGKCLMCCRYFTSYIYTLARNSPTFCPTAAIQIQVFANQIAVEKPVDEALSHSSKIGTDDGYRASAMLFADESWAQSNASRNDLNTLLWKPVVRFNCSDYKFVLDSDGTPRVVQCNLGAPQQDFASPPCL